MLLMWENLLHEYLYFELFKKMTIRFSWEEIIYDASSNSFTYDFISTGRSP